MVIPAGTKEVNFKLSPAITTAHVTVTPNQKLLETEYVSVRIVLTPNVIRNAPDIDSNPFMTATRVSGVYSNFTENKESGMSMGLFPGRGVVSGQ